MRDLQLCQGEGMFIFHPWILFEDSCAIHSFTFYLSLLLPLLPLLSPLFGKLKFQKKFKVFARQGLSIAFFPMIFLAGGSQSFVVGLPV